MIGVNLSGAEFGYVGGQYGYSYIYPSASDIQYYADRGVEMVRLPVLWERLQPTANGALDTEELGRLTKFLDDAQTAGVKVLVDVHNFGTYYGEKLGSEDVPASQFADFWQKLAAAIEDKPALAAYDLMNEPHDLAAGAWPSAAQAAVDAIRSVDLTHSIYVEGENWASASNWSATNANLDIFDPVGKIVYEAHTYFDRYSSGTYQGSYDQEGATPDIGATRIADFAQWLDDHGAKGVIGEVAVPDTDPRWLTVLDNYLTAANDAGLDTFYWGAGPWWGDYPLALRNADGSESAQLNVLESHITAEAQEDDGPVDSLPVLPAIPPLLGGLAQHASGHADAGDLDMIVASMKAELVAATPRAAQHAMVTIPEAANEHDAFASDEMMDSAFGHHGDTWLHPAKLDHSAAWAMA